MDNSKIQGMRLFIEVVFRFWLVLASESYILKRYGVCLCVCALTCRDFVAQCEVARRWWVRSRVRVPVRSNIFCFLFFVPLYFFYQIEMSFAAGPVRAFRNSYEIVAKSSGSRSI